MLEGAQPEEGPEVEVVLHGPGSIPELSRRGNTQLLSRCDTRGLRAAVLGWGRQEKGSPRVLGAHLNVSGPGVG